MSYERSEQGRHAAAVPILQRRFSGMQPWGNFEVFALQKSHRSNLVIESNISIYVPCCLCFPGPLGPLVRFSCLIFWSWPCPNSFLHGQCSFSLFQPILSKIVNASVSKLYELSLQILSSFEWCCNSILCNPRLRLQLKTSLASFCPHFLILPSKVNMNTQTLLLRLFSRFLY